MDNTVRQYVKEKLNPTEYQMFCQLENTGVNMYAIANLVIDAYYNGQLAMTKNKILFPNRESEIKNQDVSAVSTP